MKKLGRRGSGIVTVLMTTVLITVFGSSMLFLAYNAYLIRLSDRMGKQAFYDAETSMNRVRIAMQNVATVAIRAAYADTLSRYSETSDRQTAFAEVFIQKLIDYKFSQTDPSWSDENDDKPFGSPAGNTGRYNLSYLSELLGYEDDERIELGAGGDYIINGTHNVTLKNVSLRFYDKGYETSVATDIVIRVPEFAYVVPEYVLGVVYDYTTVATGTLKIKGNNTIQGNCYFGKIEVGGGNTLTLGDVDESKGETKASTIVCGDYVSLASGAGFFGNDKLVLWATRYLLDSAAELRLLGDSYVADDLRLNGDRASVTLGGRFYGFGKSSTDPAQSSSILVNGAMSKLNFKNLETLMLAGYSFVNANNHNDALGGNVNLGGSLSVRSDQTFFLVPAELLTITKGETVYKGNPILVPNDGTLPSIRLNQDLVLAYLGDSLRNIYGEITLHTISWALPSNNNFRVIYCFLGFADTATANRYILDYFTHNYERAQDYLSSYIDLYEVGTEPLTDILQTAGSMYAPVDDSGEYSLLPPESPATIETLADRLSAMYYSLSRSLTSSGANSYDTPYTTLVNREKVNAMDDYVPGNPDTMFSFDISLADGEEGDGTIETSAVIINNRSSSSGAFRISSLFEEYSDKGRLFADVSVIIASGDVIVDRDFVGLIVCDGDITMQGGSVLKSNGGAVTRAFMEAKNNETDKALEYFMRQEGSETVDETLVSWDLYTVVVYDTWEKNREGTP